MMKAMSAETQRLLTVGEVADKLQMTPDGVYKLIQRGKLDAVRLSERKTRIPQEAFNRYYAGLEGRADQYLVALPRVTADQARAEFKAATGQEPEAWLAAWKRDELEDSPENMGLLVRASAIQATSAGVSKVS